jgi:O-antigen/teichoic acid export membrane protein
VGLGAQALFLGLARRGGWRPRLSPARLCHVFRRYRRYLLDVPNQLLAALSLHAQSFILLALFGPSEVGFYSIAYRLTALPLGIFSSSLSQVYFQKAARAHRESGFFWKELRFNLLASAALAAAIFLPLALWARPLAAFYLGGGWDLSGQIMLYLSPVLALRFVSVSISTTPLVTGKLHWLLFHNLARVAALGAPALIAQTRPMPLAEYILLNVVLDSLVHLTFIALLVIHTRRHHARPRPQPL